MRKIWLTAAALALAACADEAPAPALAPIGPPAPDRSAAAKVEAVEIGRTFDGWAVLARGVFPGLGWSAPGLRLIDEAGPGVDGFIDLTLTAQPPSPGFSPEGVTRLTGYALMRSAPAQGAVGVRVSGAAGALEAPFPRETVTPAE